MWLEQQTCWKRRELTLWNDKPHHLIGMAAGRSADELFLVDSANNVVRAFNTSTGQLAERDVYPGSVASGFVESVAYSALTDTLFTCTWRAEVVHTVHRVCWFARINAKWHQRGYLRLRAMGKGVLRALSDGRLVFGGEFKSDRVHVLELDSNSPPRLKKRTRILFESKQQHNGFDARLAPAGGEIWLAVAQSTESEGLVILFSGNSAKELDRRKLQAPWMPLFYGDSLFVYTRTVGSNVCDGYDWEVHQLSIKSGRFGESLVIVKGCDPQTVRKVFAPEWCVANDAQQLVAWNLEHDKLMILYEFCNE